VPTRDDSVRDQWRSGGADLGKCAERDEPGTIPFRYPTTFAARNPTNATLVEMSHGGEI